MTAPLVADGGDPSPAPAASIAAPHESSSRYGAVFWVAVVVGGAAALWGVVEYLDAVPDLARRIDLAVWLVGSDLIHDLIVAPVVLGIGWVLSRLVPAPARAPVQAATILSATVLVLAWMPLNDTAARAGNETIQPLDYGTATLTALVVVWLGCAAWGVGRALRASRTSRASTPS